MKDDCFVPMFNYVHPDFETPPPAVKSSRILGKVWLILPCSLFCSSRHYTFHLQTGRKRGHTSSHSSRFHHDVPVLILLSWETLTSSLSISQSWLCLMHSSADLRVTLLLKTSFSPLQAIRPFRWLLHFPVWNCGSLGLFMGCPDLFPNFPGGGWASRAGGKQLDLSTTELVHHDKESLE